MNDTSSRIMKAALTAGLAVTFALWLAAEPAAAAKAPVGKTYFLISLGMATDEFEAYQLDVGCVRFTRDEMCDSGADCGPWWRIDEADRAKQQWRVGFEFEMIDDETGLPIRINGTGRVDSRGKRSSIAGAGHAVEMTTGRIINFAMAGRAVGRARCERLVADYAAGQQ